jgi:DNA-binding transcriptional LysR family regulator
MELGDLHIFRSVVQAGGITRAAEKLHRVQSNVTTRVRQLEQELGVELFTRDGKRLHLSPAGKVLLDYADRLLDLAGEAREAVHDTKPRGLFRLGSMESTAATRLPGPLSDYTRRYPEVKLELHTGNTPQLATKVLAGELDAAVVAEPVADAPFDKTPLFDEEVVLIAAAGHPPIKSPRDAEPSAVLAFEPGCAYRLRLEEWFARKNDMPERIIEMSSYHAILACAVAGMGIGVVPRIVLATFPDIRHLSVHELPAGLNRAQSVLIRRKGVKSPKIDAFLEVLATPPAEQPPAKRRGRNGHRNGA